MPKKVNNKVGKKFGRLTVLSYVGMKKQVSFWLCRCVCGRIVSYSNSRLYVRGDYNPSCGHHRRTAPLLSGKRFGRLIVLSRAENKDNYHHWWCKCDCGKVKKISGSTLLRANKNVGCGCGHIKNIVRRRFGKLVVMAFSHTKNKHSFWLCRCDCGKKKIINGGSLKTGGTRSCGCLREEEHYNVDHGFCIKKKIVENVFYRRWTAMLQRCLNRKQKGFKNYGGRGIKVCVRWLKFINFKKDMYLSFLSHLKKFGQHETTLERSDVNGNYCKKNCCWATRDEQAKNKQKSKKL